MFKFIRKWLLKRKLRRTYLPLVKNTLLQEKLVREDMSYNDYLSEHFQSRQNLEMKQKNTKWR